MAILDCNAAWRTIEAHQPVRLNDLFSADPGRVARLSRDAAGIHFDFSKTHLDEGTLEEFAVLAYAVDYPGARDALFSGDIVNSTENRAATHVAERGEGSPNDNQLASERHGRMRSLIDAIEAGAFGEVESILHIGIGGSALGPDLVIDALGRDADRFEVRVLSNIDGEAFDEATWGLDPASTLIVAASKTFTTTETLTNLEAALEWLREAGVSDPYGQVIAVTASPDKAIQYGIDETRILPFSEGVGGRYSLWSSVGLSVALALGWGAFEELLEGAAEMDRHVKLTDGVANVALLAAFADLFYTQVWRTQSRAIFAYDERLRLLPDYLQQLEMESNGKSVTSEGKPLGRPSAPVTWGGVGTDAQHAVFQLLHQGTTVIPVEFVAVVENDDSVDPRHHHLLLGNCFAQGAALMAGREQEDSARAYSGDRPSTTVLLQRLEPRSLGALISFYEHRTFANAVLLGINPFDQFGVELGKEMAKALDDPDGRAKLDPSTRDLIERAGL
ncbi:glucose-6-phosphate isomerase [Sphingomonas sp. NSE70-1]|uniref:Glucose-6-phosphate isomerase n=1 Tax=Sphingomonas caseinilyticus TaxID=2908205 RepID=A0ABT0RSJ7_9SPHN|nr:glucose-6-phosphate isomerase [Sphingomonas caseinilyticus]MCL6697984.1 glucose-6-phosphate isomerase [Sphingomonas caseinilyticus]